MQRRSRIASPLSPCHVEIPAVLPRRGIAALRKENLTNYVKPILEEACVIPEPRRQFFCLGRPRHHSWRTEKDKLLDKLGVIRSHCPRDSAAEIMADNSGGTANNRLDGCG